MRLAGTLHSADSDWTDSDGGSRGKMWRTRSQMQAQLSIDFGLKPICFTALAIVLRVLVAARQSPVSVYWT